MKKPEWGKTDVFPFMIPKFEFCSMMLGDYVTHNNLKEYDGPLMMR